jgi:PhnB protein
MPSRVNPYLSFRDNAREAMEFYKSVFGWIEPPVEDTP